MRIIKTYALFSESNVLPFYLELKGISNFLSLKIPVFSVLSVLVGFVL